MNTEAKTASVDRLIPTNRWTEDPFNRDPIRVAYLIETAGAIAGAIIHVPRKDPGYGWQAFRIKKDGGLRLYYDIAEGTRGEAVEQFLKHFWESVR